jgi:ribonuclease D
MSTTSLISDPATIAAACARLEATPRVALDTEFLRERTYRAELALVQLADSQTIALVDPMPGAGLGPLVDLLLAPGRVKVLHAARQDIEVLLPLTGVPLAPVFDTQIAAALLGFPPQIGYADLVQRVLGLPIAKAGGRNLARTDWTRRPLTGEQLEYAEDDVRYLLELAQRLEEQLESRGRLDWLAEECLRISDPALYRQNPADAWQRFKGVDALPQEERARLKALAEWREARAQRRNLPRGWVLSDEAARELARNPPATIEALQARRIFKEDTAARLGPDLLAALAGARDAGDGPERVNSRPSAEEDAVARLLGRRLKAVAEELGLAPELLATQRDLKRLARGERELSVLTGWRGRIAGPALLELLAPGPSR